MKPLSDQIHGPPNNGWYSVCSAMRKPIKQCDVNGDVVPTSASAHPGVTSSLCMGPCTEAETSSWLTTLDPQTHLDAVPADTVEVQVALRIEPRVLAEQAGEVDQPLVQLHRLRLLRRGLRR